MEKLSFIKECHEMIRRGSSTFYQAFSFLPQPRRDAVYVVYAFCRLVDDAVDEPDRSPFTLEELRAGFHLLDRAEGHFIWPALRWLFRLFPMPKTPFYLQMEGQRTDTLLTHYDTMEQLDRYCYLVAGTVGEMLTPILCDDPDEKLIESAVYLGKAMQITNILRDVGEDQARNRRYLPKELMLRFGYTEEDWSSGVVNSSFIALLEYLASLSELWLKLGLRHLDKYPTFSAFSVELAARGYQAITEEVRKQGYDSYRHRAVVSRGVKLALAQGLTVKYGLGLEPGDEKAASS